MVVLSYVVFVKVFKCNRTIFKEKVLFFSSCANFIYQNHKHISRDRNPFQFLALYGIRLFMVNT